MCNGIIGLCVLFPYCLCNVIFAGVGSDTTSSSTCSRKLQENCKAECKSV